MADVEKTFDWPKPYAKYGLTDDTGKALTPAVFDGLRISKNFIFAKRKGKWANITFFESWDKQKYDIEDVRVSDFVAWIKMCGKWGLVEATGRILEDQIYDEVIEIPKSTIMIAKKGIERRLFTAEGIRILEKEIVVNISEFYSGYAMVTVAGEQPNKDAFYVLRMDGVVASPRIGDVYFCERMVSEFRNNFAWIKNGK